MRCSISHEIENYHQYEIHDDPIESSIILQPLKAGDTTQSTSLFVPLVAGATQLSVTSPVEGFLKRSSRSTHFKSLKLKMWLKNNSSCQCGGN